MKSKNRITGTIQAWADSLGMDSATIRRKLNRAEIKFSSGEQLLARDIFRALTAETEKDQAMTRKLNAEAEARERKNKIENGQLYNLAAIEKVIWQDRLAPLRAELLSMHRTLAPRCVDPETSEEVLKNWVDATLAKLRAMQPSRQTDNPSPEGKSDARPNQR